MVGVKLPFWTIYDNNAEILRNHCNKKRQRLLVLDHSYLVLQSVSKTMLSSDANTCPDVSNTNNRI